MFQSRGHRYHVIHVVEHATCIFITTGAALLRLLKLYILRILRVIRDLLRKSKLEISTLRIQIP